MITGCCCGNCQYFANDSECSKFDMDVYFFQWCQHHHMDWDKYRGGADGETKD